MVSNNERTERLQISLCAEELREIDDFRFAHRIQNRAAAVRELFRRALAIPEEDGRFAPPELTDRRRVRIKRGRLASPTQEQRRTPHPICVWMQ
jgi:hypothetical protein